MGNGLSGANGNSLDDMAINKTKLQDIKSIRSKISKIQWMIQVGFPDNKYTREMSHYIMMEG